MYPTGEEFDQMVNNVRASSTFQYPKNLLTREETQFCIQHSEKLAEHEVSPNPGADLPNPETPDYPLAKIKIAAEYHGLSYRMPGVGISAYRKEKVNTHPIILQPIMALLNHLRG